MSIFSSGRFKPATIATAAAVASLVIATGVAAATTTVRPAAQAAPSTADVLDFARKQLALCQVELHDTSDPAARARAQNCINDTMRAIADLSRGTPTPTPSVTTAGPSPSPTVGPTSASPTPAPTTSGPSSTPSPTATSPAPAGFPGPNNTGPLGATLTTWPGCPANGSPASIGTPGLLLDHLLINCDLRIGVAGVVIKFSKINGSIYDGEPQNCPGCSFTITDSEIDAGINHNAAVWHTDLTALRDNIHGGITSVSCVRSCHVEDSWLHGQRHDPNAVGQHYGGFLSNGGGDVNHQSLIRHNTIVCDVPQVDPGTGDQNISSCSGDVNLFGDFGGVSYYTFDNNFLGTGTEAGHPSLCAYGGNSGVAAGVKQPGDHIVYTNNVFERNAQGICGAFGPVGDIDMTRPGMVWTGNHYEDGEVINP